MDSTNDFSPFPIDVLRLFYFARPEWEWRVDINIPQYRTTWLYWWWGNITVKQSLQSLQPAFQYKNLIWPFSDNKARTFDHCGHCLHKHTQSFCGYAHHNDYVCRRGQTTFYWLSITVCSILSIPFQSIEPSCHAIIRSRWRTLTTNTIGCSVLFPIILIPLAALLQVVSKNRSAISNRSDYRPARTTHWKSVLFIMQMDFTTKRTTTTTLLGCGCGGASERTPTIHWSVTIIIHGAPYDVHTEIITSSFVHILFSELAQFTDANLSGPTDRRHRSMRCCWNKTPHRPSTRSGGATMFWQCNEFNLQILSVYRKLSSIKL